MSSLTTPSASMECGVSEARLLYSSSFPALPIVPLVVILLSSCGRCGLCVRRRATAAGKNGTLIFVMKGKSKRERIIIRYAFIQLIISVSNLFMGAPNEQTHLHRLTIGVSGKCYLDVLWVIFYQRG